MNKESKESSKKLVKNTAILSFGTLCTKGIMFIMTPLLTRWLTQADYGLFDLLLTYVSLLVPFVTLDIGEATFRFLVQNVENDYEKDKKIVSSSVLMTILGIIISLIIILIVSFFSTNIRNILPYFYLLLVCESIYTFVVFLIRGLKKLPTYAITNIIYVLTMSLSAFVLLHFLKLGLSGILIAYSIGYIVSSIFAVSSLKIYKYISLKSIDISVLKDMLKYSLPMMPNSISWWIINVSDRTIVSTVLGTSVNAVYAVANKIPNLCQTFFSVFHLSWQENAVEMLDKKDRDEYYSKVMNTTIKVLISICILILSMNFLFFKLLFTEAYAYGYYQVPILILSIILSMLSSFIGGIYIARMESKKNGITTVFAAITNLAFHLILINYIGLYAATISTLISYALLFIIRYKDIKKNINIQFSNETYILFAIIMYFFITAYFNNIYINIFNFIVSIIIFFIINRDYIFKICEKMKILKNNKNE